MPLELAADGPVVLIVDDDPDVGGALKFALEIEGFAVRLYSNAHDVLQAEMPQRGCLVIDYRIPDMTGLDLLAALRHRAVTLPAILITSNPGADVRRRAADAGMIIVEKPLFGENLLQCICGAIAK